MPREQEKEFEEYVGQEGDLTGLKPEDLTAENKQVEEPSQDPGTVAEVETDTATAEDPAPVEPTAEDPASEGGEPPTDTVPEKTPYQKRIDELTRKRREAERRAAIAEARLEERDKLRAEENTKPEPIDETGKPDEDDFDTYDEYYTALASWQVEKKIAEWKKAEDDSKQAAFITQQEANFRAKLAKGTEAYEDFNEVVFDETVPITETIVSILRDTENPSDIAYYLGKNRKEASQISRMTPIQAAKAIGKIEAEIAADRAENPAPKVEPKPKPITKAPPPITPVGSTTVITKDPDKMSHEEYRKWRKEGGGK